MGFVMTELIILRNVMLKRVTLLNKGFHFVRSAVKLNLVMSCSKDTRRQIPCNSAEPNGEGIQTDYANRRYHIIRLKMICYDPHTADRH
jgi:hypothetical protein